MRTRRQLAEAFRAGHLTGLTREECVLVADCLGEVPERLDKPLGNDARSGAQSETDQGG